MVDIKVLASGSTGNAYLLTLQDYPVLIECGIGATALRKGLGYHLTGVRACLISHEHGDHSRAVKKVLQAGVEVYCSQGTAKTLSLDTHYRVHKIANQKPFVLGPWNVYPFSVIHDSAEPLGFVLAAKGAKVLYATDTSYIEPRFAGLTHIMVECNYDPAMLDQRVEAGEVHSSHKERIYRGHFNLEYVKQYLRQTDLTHVQGIWLLHSSQHSGDADRFQREIAEQTGKPVFVA